MAVYTHLSNEDIAALMTEAYGFRALKFAIGIAQGVSNSNYLVVVEDVSGNEIKTILTLFEARTDPKDVPFFLQLMQHLATHGIECPGPIARTDGALYGEVAGKTAALVSFLEGKSRTRIEAVHAGEVGAALAKLHRAGENFAGQRTNALSLSGWQAIAEKVLPRLDEIQQGLQTLVRDALSDLAAQWQSVTALPRGIIHADFFPDNVFFEGDRVSGMIDFYFACTDVYAYDLAIAVNAWCFEPSREFNFTKSQQLLRQYQNHRPLTDAEKQALPLLMRGASMRFLLTRAQDWLFREKSALVTPKDPLEYAAKLRFHQRVKSASEYGA